MKEQPKLLNDKGRYSMKGSCLWGILLFLVLILVDQITKVLADVYFVDMENAPVAVIPGWIELTITYNRGIAYGMGDDSPMGVKLAVVIVTAVMMLALTVYYFIADKRRGWLRTALVFVVAGGVGNLIDRVYYKVWDPARAQGIRDGVRDMVDLSRFGFAVCNFADFFIVAGAIMLVLSLLFWDKDAVFPVGKYKAMAEAEAAEKETKNG